MGVQVARINFPVIRRDTEGLDLDFALADRCVEAFVSRGLELDLQLLAPYGDGPGPLLPRYLDLPLTQSALYPLRENAYRRYVREAVARYGRHARFFQIGNEPTNAHQYGGTPEEYVASARQAVDEIRARFPDAAVTNGGYCFASEATVEVARGLCGLTDFVSYHWHGGLEGLGAFLPQIAEVQRAAGCGEVRYANTEMGLAMPTVAHERAHAVAEMQKALYCWAHGHLGVLFYSSRELWWPRQFAYSGISDYGFVDHFFCPRSAYGAASAFLAWYAGCRFMRVLEESAELHAYEFARGEERLIALFAGQGPQQVTLATDARRTTLIDPMGNESRPVEGREVALTVGEYPQTVRLFGATYARVATAAPPAIDEPAEVPER
jgi:hypothetical protein